MSRRRRRAARKRVGRVSYFLHHGSWYVYYRSGTRPVRVRIGQNEADARESPPSGTLSLPAATSP